MLSCTSSGLTAKGRTDRRAPSRRRRGSSVYYYGARFLQADSVVPGAENPQALNRYSYVLDNPIVKNDPTGHCAPGIGNCPDRESGYLPRSGGGAGPSGGSGGDAGDGGNLSDEYSANLPGQYDPDWSRNAQIALCQAFGCESVHNYYGPGIIFPGLEDDLFSAPLRKLGRFKPWQPRGQFEYIALPADVAASFKGGVYLQETLEKDLKVFRTTNKGGNAKGRWWTTEKIADAGEASNGLALRAQNRAEVVVEGIIPKGTTIFRGTAESLKTDLGTRSGGWPQIYIQERDTTSIIVTGSKALK